MKLTAWHRASVLLHALSNVVKSGEEKTKPEENQFENLTELEKVTFAPHPIQEQDFCKLAFIVENKIDWALFYILTRLQIPIHFPRTKIHSTDVTPLIMTSTNSNLPTSEKGAVRASRLSSANDAWSENAPKTWCVFSNSSCSYCFLYP